MRIRFWLFSLFMLLAVALVSENALSADKSADKPKFKWRLASVWNAGTFQFEGDRRFAEAVTKLSGGRLTITAYGAGQLVPTPGVFEAVRSGALECGGDWPSYWTGFNTAFDLLGTHVVGFNNFDYMNWIYGAGGIKHYKDLYGKYGMEYFPVAMSGMESGIRSIKRVTKLEDLAGMKIRFAGLIQGELIQKFGVTPVTMSLPEAYEGLQRGVIDAMEFSAPINDEAAKLHEVTKFWLAPGWHQTCSVYGVMINRAAYAALDDELKYIIEMAAKSVGLETMAEYGWGDSVATNKMIAYGIEVNWLSDADMDRLEAAKNEIMVKLAKENPDYAKLAKAQMQYLKDYESYRKFLGDYKFGRTPKAYPDLP